jgi:hypothetical protein
MGILFLWAGFYLLLTCTAGLVFDACSSSHAIARSTIVTIYSGIHLVRNIRSVRSGSCGPGTARSQRGLMIMQAVVGFEVDIGISSINLHLRVVWLRIPFVRLMSLVAPASENSATRGELFHLLHRQNGCSVMLRFRAMDFMNRGGSMDDLRLNDFLVNDRLDVFVNCRRTCQEMGGAGMKFWVYHDGAHALLQLEEQCQWNIEFGEWCLYL